jgi:hypothetical protein
MTRSLAASWHSLEHGLPLSAQEVDSMIAQAESALEYLAAYGPDTPLSSVIPTRT